VRENAAEAVAQAANAAVPIVQSTMEGYPRPIHRTGALVADVAASAGGGQAWVGNSLPYAGMVHNGTARMPARPYLSDGMAAAGETLKTLLSETLGQGF